MNAGLAGQIYNFDKDLVVVPGLLDFFLRPPPAWLQRFIDIAKTENRLFM
jgi:hypothetical protein